MKNSVIPMNRGLRKTLFILPNGSNGEMPIGQKRSGINALISGVPIPVAMSYPGAAGK